jgi:hypothetical protein
MKCKKCGSVAINPLCKSCESEIQFNLLVNKPKNKTEDIKNYQKNYIKERRKTDSLFKAVCDVRAKFNQALKVRSWQIGGTNERLFGADRNTVMAHIEKNFKEGMTWENKGLWHIDHVVPLSSAKTIEQLYNLCNYLNLSPEWKEVNMSKGASIPDKVRKTGSDYKEAQLLVSWYYFKIDCSLELAKTCAIHSVELMLNNSFCDIGYWESVKNFIPKIKDLILIN